MRSDDLNLSSTLQGMMLPQWRIICAESHWHGSVEDLFTLLSDFVSVKSYCPVEKVFTASAMRYLAGKKSWCSWEFASAQNCRKLREPSSSVVAQRKQICLGNGNPPVGTRAIIPTFAHAVRGRCARRKSFHHDRRQKNSPSRTSLFLVKIFTATEEGKLHTLLPKFLHTSLQPHRDKL